MGPRAPLILSGHGVKIKVDRDTLVVQDGFTHHPQTRNECRFFRGDRNLPSRIIVLDGRGGLSFQALAWLSSQGVPLVQVDWQGNVVTVAGSDGRAADQKLVDAQRAAKENGRGLQFAKQLIALKISNSIETLQESFLQGPATEVAITRLEEIAVDLEKITPRKPNDLRGVEGGIALAYLRGWQSFPLRWKGTGRKPIADDWRRIGWRRSHLSDLNRHAHHPVNAMLNYAYGILENDVRTHLVARGFDLTIGALHSYHHDKQPLVYDLMEPLRPIVDRAVLEIVQSHTFSPGDFTVMPNGVCRLNPHLAKAIVAKLDLTGHVPKVLKKAQSALRENTMS